MSEIDDVVGRAWVLGVPMSATDDDRDLMWAVDLFVDRLAEFVEDPVAVVESGGCGLGDGRLITAAELIEISRDEGACD